jgi:hypothetical protein
MATGFGRNKYDGHPFTVFKEEDGLLNREFGLCIPIPGASSGSGTMKGLAVLMERKFKSRLLNSSF